MLTFSFYFVKIFDKETAFLIYTLPDPFVISNEKRDNKQCLLDTPRRVTVTNKRLKSKHNQRTNGPVNAHLISWPSKAQNIQNLEKYMVKK